MVRFALALVLAIELGGGFGTATATVVVPGSDSMNVDIEVEVDVSADSVVAHLVAPGQPELTLPLLQRSPGVFGIQTDIPAIDYQVVFEAIAEVSVQSRPVSLTEMGADLGIALVTTTTEAEDGLTNETRQWGWLALGLAAASLSALAFWVLGAGPRKTDVEEEPSEVETPEQV